MVTFYDDPKPEFGKVNIKRFLKSKWIKIGLPLLFLVFLYFHFFIYYDSSNSCFIKIRFSYQELSNTTIKKGLELLKRAYPSQYKDVCKYVSEIEPMNGCGGFGGGCYYVNPDQPRMIYVSTPYGHIQDAAKVLIHEACHAEQAAEKRSINEPECYAKDAVIPWENRDTGNL